MRQLSIHGSQDTGKRVFSRLYCHISSLPTHGTTVSDLVESAAWIAKVHPETDFNVVRLDNADQSIGLLHYPEFFDEAFPRLHRSWKVNLSTDQISFRNYEDSLNPPILHRKELMLAENHAQSKVFSSLTKELEQLGLFADPLRIGFKREWDKLLAERGFRVIGHQIVPLGNEEAEGTAVVDDGAPIEIARHLTALSRQNFSAPIQMLWRHGLFDGSRTLFDYGCGKGDDLRGLMENGIRATGWDPYYAASSSISAARIVNLGFVINVIENPVERREALKRAYTLAEELLVVSTMVATENPPITPFGDGVLTSRSTFQKYYTQAELREYLRTTLDEEPISIAPGIFFVFKDKSSEQRFQAGRYRSRIRIRPLTRPQTEAEPIRRHRQNERSPDDDQIHRALLDALWALCLDLGRQPEAEEIQNAEEIQKAFGSIRKALRLVLSRNNLVLLENARRQRADDLRVFLALQQFSTCKPYKHLETRLQRDIRAFFGNYASAQDAGKVLLYSVSRPEVLDQACLTAAEQGLGWLEPSHSLQLHSSLVPRLPASLRVYVACACVLYGDANEADLVKIHIRSNKVSFLKYDNFLGTALPRMIERTKISLRSLDMQIFSYGAEYPSPLLYLKSRYINEEIPDYAGQLAFDQALIGLGIIDLSSFGPSEADLLDRLRRARWRVNGFKLERLHLIPDLDDLCGEHFTYRQLIECGETQSSTGLANCPKRPESYTALLDLATNILDPMIEYFGGIKITYGFCSPELARRIPHRVAPALDQHTAHEHNRLGKCICSRLGAAVDFLVPDEDMKEISDWIIANLPFDRMYYYGKTRPVHISFGPDHARQAFELVANAHGKLVPRPYR
jgi:DNA phosphorothioation-associated putative methyltransferase